jgi:hypothetical protein
MIRITTADAITSYHAPTWLPLFAQLNLAECAAARAKQAAFHHSELFKAEYATAQMWMQKQVKI